MKLPQNITWKVLWNLNTCILWKIEFREKIAKKWEVLSFRQFFQVPCVESWRYSKKRKIHPKASNLMKCRQNRFAEIFQKPFVFPRSRINPWNFGVFSRRKSNFSDLHTLKLLRGCMTLIGYSSQPYSLQKYDTSFVLSECKLPSKYTSI